MSNLAIELPREIARVTELMGEYCALRAMPNVIVEPQIAMMRGALDRATRALGSGDVVAMLRCYADLKEYTG